MSKHVLKIAISPMLTGLGMNMGKLLAGTIIVAFFRHSNN
jgi:nickel transport system permease protein